MFLSGALVGVATLIRQPSAVTLGAMLACLVYVWLIPRAQSLGRVLAAGTGVLTGFVAVIAGLAWYYRWQGIYMTLTCGRGRLRFATSSPKQPSCFVLKRLVTVHLV